MFKKWIIDNLSDFTTKINSRSDYELLVQNPSDKDINKVLLFTKKENVPPAIKALSAEFRDRLRFSVIALPEGKENADNLELKKDYEVESLPRIVVEQTYEAKANKVLEQYLIHEYKQTDFKIAQLVKFLRPFARDEPKEENDDIAEQRENQRAKEEEKSTKKKEVQEWHVNVDDKNFTSEVLDKSDANLVYFTLLPTD